jgi:hypothetical protein
MTVRSDSLLGRIADAAKRPPPLLHIRVSRRWARLLIAAGARPALVTLGVGQSVLRPFTPTRVDAVAARSRIDRIMAEMLQPGALDEASGHVLDSRINAWADKWVSDVTIEHAQYVAVMASQAEEAEAQSSVYEAELSAANETLLREIESRRALGEELKQIARAHGVMRFQAPVVPSTAVEERLVRSASVPRGEALGGAGIELAVSDASQLAALGDWLRNQPGVNVTAATGPPDSGDPGVLDLLSVAASRSGVVAAIRTLPEFIRARRSGFRIELAVRGERFVIDATNVEEVLPLMERLFDV